MKKYLPFLLASLLVLFTSCDNTSNNVEREKNSYSYALHSEEIGDFNLLSPSENQIVMDIPTFSWEEATNADSYTLEVASSADFASDDAVYIKKSGIVTTSFAISSQLKYKDIKYYWRVTAKNSKKSKECNGECGSFFYKSNSDEEISFSIDYADEWVVHKEGSQADISIDNSNFFNNNKKSLVIKFDGEDTNKGTPSSDGWIVVTHQQEVEMYGVDSFFFNFYYSGQNSHIYLRVVDEDNEYYNAEIKLANNVKQTVIMKFDDFTLRTKGGTTIANQRFDYNNIKYVELVFEETFGDGICMLSDLKAVSYEKYQYMFFNQLDFNEVNEEDILLDKYEFDVDLSNDGSALTMSYGGDIGGYGFVKVPVNKFMETGDALKVHINYEGASNANILIRLIEEDKDRWVYKQSAKTIPSDGIITIPYNAFTLSEYNGDGNRQFYYLKQIQFGIENVYSKGSIEFKDVSICNLSDNIENLFIKDIEESKTIEGFDEYTNTAEMYYKWQLSTSNKDEALTLNTDRAFGANNKCVKLGYKSDMGPAYYGLQFTNAPEGYNAISFWINDASIKYEDAAFNHISDVSAKLILSLYVTSGEEYIYVIDALNKYWCNYTINFKDFRLTSELLNDTVPLESSNVVGIKMGFQYYYYNKDGSSHPVYKNDNAIFLDNIRFDNGETFNKELSNRITPSEGNTNISVVDTFESYDEESLTSTWATNGLSYCGLSLENDETNKSMKMKYKGNSDSVAYSISTLFASDVQAKAIKMRLKGDDKATVYVNLYINYAGNNYKYRATLSSVASSWKTYTIGFSNFTQVEGTTLTLSNKLVTSIYKISFGIVNSSNNNESYVYVDDIMFDYSVPYSTNKVE